MSRVKNPQDFWAGLLFLAVGCLALWFGRGYAFGTATKMGPGYLPTVLSWVLGRARRISVVARACSRAARQSKAA